jgi:hypothetical protein
MSTDGSGGRIEVCGSGVEGISNNMNWFGKCSSDG